MRRLVVADRVRTASGVVGDAVLIEDGKVAAVGEARSLRDERTEEVQTPRGDHPWSGRRPLPPLRVRLGGDRVEIGWCRRLQRVGGSHHCGGGSSCPPARQSWDAGCNDETLAERRLPTRHDLDRMVSGRPVLLNRVCGHLAVASTAALEAAGVSPSTTDPVGGSFDRDRSGMPTGVLRETAVAVVTQGHR